MCSRWSNLAAYAVTSTPMQGLVAALLDVLAPLAVGLALLLNVLVAAVEVVNASIPVPGPAGRRAESGQQSVLTRQHRAGVCCLAAANAQGCRPTISLKSSPHQNLCPSCEPAW